MSLRSRSKRVASRSLRDFLGAPRRVFAKVGERRRIKRRLRTYAGPQRRRGARRTFRARRRG